MENDTQSRSSSQGAASESTNGGKKTKKQGAQDPNKDASLAKELKREKTLRKVLKEELKKHI